MNDGYGYGDREMTVALSLLNSFQNHVQHADTKVNTLLAVHAGTALAVAAAQDGRLAGLGPARTVLLAAFAVALLASGHHLLQALRPRLHPPRQNSRFGISSAFHRRAGVPPAPPPGDAEAERAEAWVMIRLFADLARAKHARVARAVPWTAAMLVTGLTTVILR